MTETSSPQPAKPPTAKAKGESGVQYSERYDAALLFAADQHRYQERKGGKGIPYVYHLLAVSALVWEDGGDEDQAIAALLHDVLEDTPTQPDELRERFGLRATSFVELCTDANPAEGEVKQPWRPRKEAHFEHLIHTADSAGLRVTCADKVHNIEAQIADARAAGTTTLEQAKFWDHFKGGFAGTLWYYRNVCEAIGDSLGDSQLFARLKVRVGELAQLWKPEGEHQIALQQQFLAVLTELNPVRVSQEQLDKGYYQLDADELLRRLICAGLIPAGVIDAAQGAEPAKSQAETVDAAEAVLEKFTTKVYGGWTSDAGISAKQTICDLVLSQS
ncbi:unannotated protein [freshwater metagenome]|uniref:Unannotated protein n=1 Tax=freshwater metagenome TaxID=449393 RepID=A0A6J7MY55_9ZZZZ|nr:HD domain-containing protein [Actinomycetota bacterium]MSV85113.1 HD domain-containing protein [Actinomycetota bacterium]MSX75352.1 HD domain-containing protein [Actinomycetota bacterium]